jgi:hypothetical protein
MVELVSATDLVGPQGAAKLADYGGSRRTISRQTVFLKTSRKKPLEAS